MNERQSRQAAEVYRYMKEHGEITQRDAMSFGCYRLSGRIWDLKQNGVPISRVFRAVPTANGRKAHIAVYSIRKEDITNENEA